MTAINFTNDQTNNIITLYIIKKISSNKIAQLFNCSANSIIRLLNNNNIPIRNRSQCQQICSVDDTRFKVIDSHEKAYWLGILTGDGSVHKNHIALSMIDEEHIYKFRNFMKSSHKIRQVVGDYVKKDGKNSVSYVIDIWNEKISKDLLQYNLYTDKTNHMLFPNNIGNKYISSYILGLIDSDGWLHVNYKLNMIYIGFCGTYDMTNKVMHILMENCNLKELKIQPTKSKILFNFAYGGNLQGTRICKFLYSETPVFLKRKKTTAINFLASKYPSDGWLQNNIVSI